MSDYDYNDADPAGGAATANGGGDMDADQFDVRAYGCLTTVCPPLVSVCMLSCRQGHLVWRPSPYRPSP